MTQAKKKGTLGYSAPKIIWFFFKPYKLDITLLMILTLIVGGLEAINIVAVYPILNVAFDTGAGQSNIILSLLATIANLLPIEDEFIRYSMIFIFIALLAFLAKLIFTRFKVRLGARLVEKKQNEVFDKYIRADYQYFLSHKQGELIYNVAGAPGIIANLINAVTSLTLTAVLVISITLLLLSLSWQGTVAVLLVGTGYIFISRYIGEKVSYRSATVEMETLRESNVILNEAISGIREVKVFVVAENWTKRFSKNLKTHWESYTKRVIWMEIPPVILLLILYLFVGGAALLIRTTSPANFTQVIPIFGTFAFAIFRLFPLIGTVGNQIMTIMSAIPNCEAVYSVLNEKMTHIKDGEKKLSSFRSSIQFDNVSFAYDGRPEVIRDISVTLERGKTIAIVGRSGTGKTTIINLLLRLFDVSKGEIRIDGLNIKEYKLSSWLNNIGFVSQDTFILNDTVKNNINFRSDRYSHEEVIKAARFADAHNFITELPEGYDTIVGDKGMKLSGGQRQRIAIARAMIREPEVLIFDEATNALDNISEVLVQNAIDRISKDRTVIIIAHRLSTIVNADKILVLADGQVAEEGTHKELMKKRGVYWELYNKEQIES